MFEKWQSIPRLNKEIIITEKIDGTNAQVHIISYTDPLWNTLQTDMGEEHILASNDQLELYMLAGSRSRYLSLEDDNFGFARWVHSNADSLWEFGPGRHYGEWYGLGIQRGYGLSERRLAMFNPRWATEGPSVVTSTPIVYQGPWHFDYDGHLDVFAPMWAMHNLKRVGSLAVPGFMDPEGIVVYHTAANQMFKQTFAYDEGKWSKEDE